MKPNLRSVIETLRERLDGRPVGESDTIGDLEIGQWGLDSLELVVLVQTLVEYSPELEPFLDRAGEDFLRLTLAEIYGHI